MNKQKIFGKTLEELLSDYQYYIFKQFLPFWEKGGYDRELGGFMCELYEDGSIQNDEKNIWYQGRGIWVYSFLYNYFGREEKYLKIAQKTRDFMLEHMYMDKGKWRESVNRLGKPVRSTISQGSEKDIYGALFAAAGLIELFKATRNVEDLSIALNSLHKSVEIYEDPNYDGISVAGINAKGLRAQAHSFIIIWILTNLLPIHKVQQIEDLQKEHVNHIINHFWNPEYRIVNEKLFHDYSRIKGCETMMVPGHSIEALWMVLSEAIRINDNTLFETAKNRIKHLIEMNWDYNFEGLWTEEYNVFARDEKCAGPLNSLKVMWAHCEMLLAVMMILEHTGESWAKEWYEQGRAFTIRTMIKPSGGWRQAVDRFGNDKKRDGITVYRNDNFHPIRYLMMNCLAIERMIKR